jgi:hypothetical protein
MKIEIDTKHDSPEEIQKVIKMLQHLVGEKSYTNTKNIFEDPSSFGTSPSIEEPTTPTEQPTNAFVNMFGDTPKDPKEEPMDEPKEEPKEESTEEKEEIPEIIPY